MNEQDIEYFDGSQKLIGRLFTPPNLNADMPAIIVFHAFEGRSEFTLNYAKAISAQGFITFAADMFGDAHVATTIEEAKKLITPFLQDRNKARQRANLAFETLVTQAHVNKNKIGAIGFCFGGMCVLEIARSGNHLKAGVSAHGVLMKSNLVTEHLKGKLLILHGYQDPQVPPTMLHEFAEEMATVNNNDWIFTFFGAAKHSFTDPKTGSFDPEIEASMGREYNRAAADYTYHAALEFFKDELK